MPPSGPLQNQTCRGLENGFGVVCHQHFVRTIILGGQTSPKGDFEKVEKNKKSRKWLFFWPFLDLFKTAQARTRIAGVQHTAAAAAVQLQWGGHRRHGAPPPPKQGL